MRAAVYRDWSGLPEDLILIMMRALAIPDLFRAGAACPSWRAACADVRRVRFPITDSSPCLLYTCAADSDDIATVYSVSTGAAFKVRLPAPALRSRHVVGSGHGWVVTADEESNFQAMNALTGAQVDLPPVTGLEGLSRVSPLQQRLPHGPLKLRISTYLAYLSCNPAAGSACAVLLVHQCSGHLYFAHIGDDRWTRITRSASLPVDNFFHGAAYNKNDGLFYVLHCSGRVCTLDLNGPSSPVARAILSGPDVAARLPEFVWGDIVLAPWGDILQVWRSKRTRLGGDALLDDPEAYTDSILLFRVDVDDQKLVKMSAGDLQDYALFLGFNASMCLSTKEFPGLKPNCAYVTNGYWRQAFITKFGSQEVGIWNFGTKTLESLGNVPSDNPWLNWPSPIWITPLLS